MTNHIKFDTFPGVMMLDIDLWDRRLDQLRSISLTFDTGASVTTISKEVLSRLGYKFDNCPQARITTASGIAFVDVITIDRLQLGDIVLNNVEVYAHTFPEASFSVGVLGLNIIQQFDWEIKYSSSDMRFTRI